MGTPGAAALPDRSIRRGAHCAQLRLSPPVPRRRVPCLPARRRRRGGPPNNHFHRRRLGHERRCAALLDAHDIRRVRIRDDHQHGDAARRSVLPEELAHREAIDERQPRIGHEQRGALRECGDERVATIGGFNDGPAVAAKGVGVQQTCIVVVIGDDYHRRRRGVNEVSAAGRTGPSHSSEEEQRPCRREASGRPRIARARRPPVGSHPATTVPSAD